MPGSASACAARPTAHPPMMAPAKTILAKLLPDVTRAMRCDPVIKAAVLSSVGRARQIVLRPIFGKA